MRSAGVGERNFFFQAEDGIRDTTKPAAERDARIYVFDMRTSLSFDKKREKVKSKAKNESDSEDD